MENSSISTILTQSSCSGNHCELLCSWFSLNSVFYQRQDSWFQYLFGVKESGVFGAISLATGKTTLFIPKLPNEYLVWCGTIYPPSHFQVSYAVDEVLYVEDIASWVSEQLSKEEEHGAKLHLMEGENSDSGLFAKPAKFEGSQKFWDDKKVDTSILYNHLAACRVLKNDEELQVMHYSSWVASNAHVEVMRSINSSTFEYELEAKFLYEIYKNGGCRKSAYTSICACGPNSAVLHYGHAAAPNDRQLAPTDIVSTHSLTPYPSINLIMNPFHHCIGSLGHGRGVPWVRLGHHLLVPRLGQVHGRSASHL